MGRGQDVGDSIDDDEEPYQIHDPARITAQIGRIDRLDIEPSSYPCR